MSGFPKRQSTWLSLMSLQGAENLAILAVVAPPLVLENCCGTHICGLVAILESTALVINRAIKNLLKDV